MKSCTDEDRGGDDDDDVRRLTVELDTDFNPGNTKKVALKSPIALVRIIVRPFAVLTCQQSDRCDYNIFAPRRHQSVMLQHHEYYYGCAAA